MRAIPSLLAAATMALPAPAAIAGSLDALRWKARPVVVLSDQRDDPRAAQQIKALGQAGVGVRERQIAILHDTAAGGTLRRRLGVADHGFAVVLVGKDGGVKHVWRSPVKPEEIFGLIDRMPMRRDEMRG